MENRPYGRFSILILLFLFGTLLPFPLFPIKFFLIKKRFPVDGGVLQPFHILFHLFVSDFRINLCGLDTHMPHHSGHRFNWNAQRECDMGAEIMPCLMKVKRKTVSLSQFCDMPEKITAAVKVEYLVAFPLALIFFEYPHRDVQQTDGGQGVALLPPNVDPPRAVISLRDVVHT